MTGLGKKAVAAAMRLVGRVVPGANTAGGGGLSSSGEYWKRRYADGGNSGPGSYEHLAQFKADVLNQFVIERDVKSVIEFGCGDGNQLSYANYPLYLGVDISAHAVELCRTRFHGNPNWRFMLLDKYAGEMAHLALSLDVVFHLVEDAVFEDYTRRLFKAAERFVVVFSSDRDEPVNPIAPHVRHRNFSAWVSKNISGWRLAERIPNRYQFNGDFTRTSYSDFFVFERTGGNEVA